MMFVYIFIVIVTGGIWQWRFYFAHIYSYALCCGCFVTFWCIAHPISNLTLRCSSGAALSINTIIIVPTATESVCGSHPGSKEHAARTWRRYTTLPVEVCWLFRGPWKKLEFKVQFLCFVLHRHRKGDSLSTQRSRYFPNQVSIDFRLWLISFVPFQK